MVVELYRELLQVYGDHPNQAVYETMLSQISEKIERLDTMNQKMTALKAEENTSKMRAGNLNAASVEYDREQQNLTELRKLQLRQEARLDKLRDEITTEIKELLTEMRE